MLSRSDRAIAASLVVLCALHCGRSTDPASEHPDGAFDPNDRSSTETQVDCRADWAETRDLSNHSVVDDSGISESTGLSVGQQSTLSICGEINPAAGLQDLADADVFAFSVTETIDARIELLAPNGDRLEGFSVALFASAGPTFLAEGRFVNTHGVLARRLLPGSYWLSVSARADESLTETVAYRIEVSSAAPPCTAPAITAQFSESGDGPSNRDNDVVDVDFGEPQNPAQLTDAFDQPEDTGLELVPDNAVQLSGTSASNLNIDSYHDRDTYLLTTDEDTDEIELRLSWNHGEQIDLDLFVFLAGNPSVEFTASNARTSSSTQNEATIFAVPPGTDLWLWVGAFEGSEPLPAPYQINVCPRTTQDSSF